MLKFYNTPSRKIEEFKPLNPENIKVYTCGPTVYASPHIGNWVAFIYWDILVRTLRLNGYNVTRTMNITDVGHLVSDEDDGEDKLEKGARQEGKTAWEVAEFYTDEFLKEYLIGKLVPGSICNKLIRKEIANQLRFPIGKIYEDAFYHYDLIQVANKYVVNTKPYYYYYHRGNSITTSTFSKRDFNYIEIYTKFSRYVEEHYPDLQEEMFFRLSYAYFFIFDKLLHVEGYQKLEEYKVVRDYLKQNAIKIANNQIFQKGRRLAALFLKVNVHLYRFVMLANERKTKQIH